MKKTSLMLLTLIAMLAVTWAAQPPPTVAYRTEFGIYREIIMNTNGGVVSDYFQKLSDGVLFHTFREVNPAAGVTQRLFSVVANFTDIYGSGFQNVTSTNATWSTNGTVDYDIKTQDWDEFEQVSFKGNLLSGHSKITLPNGNTKTIMSAVNFRIWLANVPAIGSFCSNYAKPNVSSAFMYYGYLGGQTRQWFPGGQAFLSPPRTNFTLNPGGKLPAVAFVNIPSPANELWEFQSRAECWWCPEDTNGACWYWGDVPQVTTTNFWFMLKPEWGPKPPLRSSANGNTNMMWMSRTEDFETYDFIGTRYPSNGFYYINDPNPPTNKAFYIFQYH